MYLGAPDPLTVAPMQFVETQILMMAVSLVSAFPGMREMDSLALVLLINFEEE